MNLVRGLTIRLRKPEAEDVPIMGRWLSDTDFLSYLYGGPFRSGASLTREVQSMLAGNAKDTSTSLTLLAETHEQCPIGLLTLNSINWKNRTAEMNTAVGDPAYRNAVYGCELYFLALLYVFSELNLRRVIGYVYERNKSALRLNDYLGKRRGVLRKHVFRAGCYQDVVVFSVDREDFLSFVKSRDKGILRRYATLGLMGDVCHDD